MKTISISGKDVTVKTVSLRKAARSMSAFVKVENGAAEANRGFLKRAAAAFNELLEFHDDLNGSKMKRKRIKESGSEQDVGSIWTGRIKGERSEEKKRDKKRRETKEKQREEIEVKKVVVGKKRKDLEEGGEERRGEDSEERRKLKKRRNKNREEDK